MGLLYRVTRIMEEHYHCIFVAKDVQTATQLFPVVVIEGMSHFQFASGDIPSHVKNNDLKPDYDTAHTQVATLVTAFICSSHGRRQWFEVTVEVTGSFVNPLINTYQLEGLCNYTIFYYCAMIES